MLAQVPIPGRAGVLTSSQTRKTGQLLSLSFICNAFADNALCLPHHSEGQADEDNDVQYELVCYAMIRNE